MEFSNEILIDTVLNVVGFLAAAALTLIVHSLFRDGRSKPVAQTPTGSTEAATSLPNETASKKSGGVITFGDRRKAGSAPDGPSNRIAVIQQARELLAEGTSPAAIKARLPINDAELALLAIERKRKA